ncbi:DUF1653 domain-containing protein [Paenibacillus sp. QZ-Y1]|uniref:DUF1653 domain-containing protein n=1 Tax=Paenibacillus sp. QZ-Y1 TaxID=3414511 RepID=UPI003F78DE75
MSISEVILLSFEETKGQSFRHYKGGLYKLIRLARHTETREVLVVYIGEDDLVWARPANMFFGHTDDGTKRFVEINECEENE